MSARTGVSACWCMCTGVEDRVEISDFLAWLSMLIPASWDEGCIRCITVWLNPLSSKLLGSFCLCFPSTDATDAVPGFHVGTRHPDPAPDVPAASTLFTELSFHPRTGAGVVQSHWRLV